MGCELVLWRFRCRAASQPAVPARVEHHGARGQFRHNPSGGLFRGHVSSVQPPADVTEPAHHVCLEPFVVVEVELIARVALGVALFADLDAGRKDY
jgi:hypothetical protein